MEIIEISVDKIKPDPNQPRKQFDEDGILDLAESIKTEGLINPIEIDKSHIIVTGELRWRAAKLVGYKTVPCKIVSVGDIERFRRQLIENIHYQSMTDWDIANALAKLLNWRPGRQLTQGKDAGIRKLAKIIGKSKDYIREHLEILEATKPMQKGIEEGDVPYTMLRAVKSAPVPYQKPLEAKILSGEFKNRDAAMAVAFALGRSPDKAAAILEKNYSKLLSSYEIDESLSEISPKFSQSLHQAMEPRKQLSNIKDDLVKWLKDNPPASIKMDDSFIKFDLLSILEAIQKWGRIEQLDPQLPPGQETDGE